MKRAEFNLTVTYLYEKLLLAGKMEEDQGEFKLDLTIQVQGHATAKQLVEFPLLNNYYSLFQTYEDNIIDGHLGDMTDPYNVDMVDND